jgi:hypothetical protein
MEYWKAYLRWLFSCGFRCHRALTVVEMFPSRKVYLGCECGKEFFDIRGAKNDNR